MGKIIQVSFDQILPGETYFNEYKLADLIKFAELNSFLPIAVRELNGKYLHLTGRHRLIHERLAGKENVSLFLAENKYDYMLQSQFPDVNQDVLSSNNFDIETRWSVAKDIYDMLNDELNIKTYVDYFNGLKNSYKFLENLKTCKKYFKNEGFL